MKKTMNKHFVLKYIPLLALPMLLGLTSCHSGDQEFPDYGSTSVYFSNQGYVRTIELGEDLEVDLTNDNNHEFSLNAAMGGGYGNKRDIKVSFVVDPTLLDSKSFDDGTPMTLLPSDYYQLESNTMVIPSGKIQGGVKVKLTDAFFADPLATTRHYVLPVRITNVEGADSVLESKNYVLCAVKFVNPWQATYLRRGQLVNCNCSSTATNARSVRSPRASLLMAADRL